MRICNSLHQADGVLHQITENLQGSAFSIDKRGDSYSDFITEFSVDAYKNGRENGYFIHAYFRTIDGESLDGRFQCAFSENRNSDSIVVYVAQGKDAEHYADEISDAMYEDRKMFGYAEYDKAATYILKELGKQIKTAVKSVK